MDWQNNDDSDGNDITAEQTTRGDAIGYMMTHHPIMAACFSKSAAIPPIMQNCILALLQQGTISLFPTHKACIDSGDQCFCRSDCRRHLSQEW